MYCRTIQFCLMLLACLFVAGEAIAHPHVWVTMKSDLVYAPDGSITGVRHAWTFDEMFSTFATQGLETKKKGVFTREELKPLAEVNVTSLKEFDFFTFGKANGNKLQFTDPVDYYLEFANSELTLYFMLPLKKPVKAQTFEFEVYDPSYFVDFALAEKDPVALVHAPAACKMSVMRPGQSAPVGETFFAQPDSSNYGAQFANKITVKCP
jgi:ABC-type uncharacterized transport system substrate-binding protein